MINVDTSLKGDNVKIELNVILDYKYHNWKRPLKLGSNIHIHSGSVLYSDTIIGDYFVCGHNVTIRANCQIGSHVVILHGSTLEGNIVIGKGVKIMSHVYIPSATKIGSMVFIGPGVTLLNAKFPMREEGISAPVIGNNVIIGGGATIGPGVNIGDNSFIGAGTTVLKDVPKNSLAYGSPMIIKELPKRFGNRNDPEQIFNGLDLWNNISNPDWQSEEFFGKEEWLKESKNT